MVIDLGFTIVPRDPAFFDRIEAFAPRSRIPLVSELDAERLAEAYHRYAFLIGVSEPQSDHEAAALEADAQEYPDLADSEKFLDDDAARLMQRWTGLSIEAVRAYLYEEFVYITACGLLADVDEDECKVAIAARHREWFGRPPLS